jgi:hypothetical protein
MHFGVAATPIGTSFRQLIVSMQLEGHKPPVIPSITNLLSLYKQLFKLFLKLRLF